MHECYGFGRSLRQESQLHAHRASESPGLEGLSSLELCSLLAGLGSRGSVCLGIGQPEDLRGLFYNCPQSPNPPMAPKTPNLRTS